MSRLKAVLKAAGERFSVARPGYSLMEILVAVAIIAVLATLVACGASYLFAYVSGGDHEAVRHRKVVLDLSLSSISLLGTIAVIFLGTNLIYQEVERRTIWLAVKPK